MTKNERLFLKIFNTINVEDADIRVSDDKIISTCKINNNTIEEINQNDKIKIMINGIDINVISIPDIISLLEI